MFALSSHAFDYVNVLDRAADASWARQTIISNNIANVDTPTYKRQDLDFGNELERALRRTGYKHIDRAVKHLDVSNVKGRVYDDHTNFSYRIDRNNVDVDTENVELASEQLRYQQITTALSDEFTRFNIVTQ